MRRLVLLLTLLLLSANGGEAVRDESCALQTFEQTVSIDFDSLPEHFSNDQIMALQEAFLISYNDLTHCVGDSSDDVFDVEIVGQQRRRLGNSNLILFNWGVLFRILGKCRGCAHEEDWLFGNEAARRSLTQEMSGPGQERRLQDCVPCERPTPEKFIADFNVVLQQNFPANAARGRDTPDNVIGAAVSFNNVFGDLASLVELEESLAHFVCENFAVHARTTITFNGGRTNIHGGDVGVFPGTSITGAYHFQAGGALVDDSSAFAALTEAAHAAAMAVQKNGKVIGTEIGGSTFTPGTYRYRSAINVAYGTVVTLDGEGDPNSVFLFQAGSTLVTGAGTRVILKNGARAENVVWALGTAATLGASSVLEGSILAGTAITFGTKSELRGCALAQSAVTFESEGYVKPSHKY